jgi:rubrerythrin
MEENSLKKLSPEQIAVLNDEQKAVFCVINEADQKFFSETFKPKDLPGALTRKGEIVKRNNVDQERMAKIKEALAKSAAETPIEKTSEDILTAVAGVVGIGAAAAVIASDNSAHWRGVKPNDLVPPLRTEFTSDKTQIGLAGNSDALIINVLLYSSGRLIPALTINLTTVNNGTEVKMSELTSHGALETIKEGGKKVLGIAVDGLHMLTQSRGGLASTADILNTANHTINQGADLAEIAGNLKLKERAWKAIKQTAESIEASFDSQQEAARQARFALEKAWDNHNHCPTCGVSFNPADTTCRVCGTAHPEKPLKPDPRAQ